MGPAYARLVPGNDRMTGLIALQDAHDLLSRSPFAALLRLPRRAADMGRGEHAAERKQRVVPARRLGLQDVDRRAGDAPLAQGAMERILIDHAPPCEIDEIGRLLHRSKLALAHHVARLVIERTVQ